MRAYAREHYDIFVSFCKKMGLPVTSLKAAEVRTRRVWTPHCGSTLAHVPLNLHPLQKRKSYAEDDDDDVGSGSEGGDDDDMDDDDDDESGMESVPARCGWCLWGGGRAHDLGLCDRWGGTRGRRLCGQGRLGRRGRVRPVASLRYESFFFLNLTPLHRRRIRYDENYESPDEEGGAPSKKGDKKKGKASRKRDDDDDEDEDGDDDDAEPAPKKAKVSKEKAPAKSKESAPKAKKPAPSKTKTTDPTKSGKGKGDDEALKRKVRPGFYAPSSGSALCAPHAAAPLTTHTQMADILDEEDED